MSTKDNSKGMNKLAGQLVLMATIVVPFLLAWFIITAGRGRVEETMPDPSMYVGFLVMNFVAGLFLVCVSIALYGVLWATNLFTFDYSKPVWSAINKTRLRIFKIAFILLFGMGLGALAVTFVTPLLLARGLPLRAARLIPFFAVILLVQYVFCLIDVWLPILRNVLRARLRTMGVTHAEMSEGRHIGVSDPAASSMLKGGSYVEDDIGLLWIRPDALEYRGDGQSFRIMHHQFQGLERGVDKGSLEAYAGARHVILNWRDAIGRRIQTRLHGEQALTIIGLAGEMDDLAEQIEDWAAQQSPQPAVSVPPPIPSGEIQTDEVTS